MRKAASIIGGIVLVLSLLGLIISAAALADASHPQPLCGSEYLNPGESCDDNGVDTSYADALAQQQRTQHDGPTEITVCALLLVGSLGLLIGLRRRDRART